MMPYMRGKDEIDVNRPCLEIISLNIAAVPLEDYVRLAIAVSRTCGIEMHFDEDESRYRFDFFLHESVLLGKGLLGWERLVGGSDLVCVVISTDRPRTIRVSFYRDKDKNSSSE